MKYLSNFGKSWTQNWKSATVSCCVQHWHPSSSDHCIASLLSHNILLVQQNINTNSASNIAVFKSLNYSHVKDAIFLSSHRFQLWNAAYILLCSVLQLLMVVIVFCLSVLLLLFLLLYLEVLVHWPISVWYKS